MNNTGFEYKNKKTETPFETFLRYTDEKEKSGIKLAAILKEAIHEDSNILDVGTGNGEYLQLALSNVGVPKGLTLTLIEPSDDLVAQLKQRFAKQLPQVSTKVIHSDLQNFDISRRYDVILMSHLFYHIPRTTWTDQLTKALSLLKPDGILIIVLRGKDDAFDFKMAFKPSLFDKSFKALTIDDVLTALPTIDLEIRKQLVKSNLKIPLEKNFDDTIAIIEFYLNKPWEEMPESIRDETLKFIKDKNGIFKQIDCIAVIKSNS